MTKNDNSFVDRIKQNLIASDERSFDISDISFLISAMMKKDNILEIDRVISDATNNKLKQLTKDGESSISKLEFDSILLQSCVENDLSRAPRLYEFFNELFTEASMTTKSR